MNKCRFCGKYIQWQKISDRWIPVDSNGKNHKCSKHTSGPVISPNDSVCAKCFLPMIGSSGREGCNCISPEWISKQEATRLKGELHK